MIDDNYYQPVLSADFHHDLTISPGGLVSNPSLKMMAPPPMAQKQDLNMLMRD